MVLNNYIPFRKIVYFSEEALLAIKQGDEEMKEFYSEYFNHRIENNDVWLYLDIHFKKLTTEQEEFILICKETALCKEL